jgi:aryl-alcohol dehydrogenase-like predicted oxidoreductase
MLGMFSKGIDNACGILKYAYDHGINFFDTAKSYGTLPAVGKAFADIPRHSYILSTKFRYAENGIMKPADEFEKYLDETLDELKTDYLDIYHMHSVLPADYVAVRDRFYPELQKMKKKGKIRFFGITEQFGADTTHQMLKTALHDDVWDVIMVGYNVLNPSAAKTIFPITMQKNVGTLNMFAVRNSLSDQKQLTIDVQKMIAAGQVDVNLVHEEKTLDFLIDKGHVQSIMEAAYRFCHYTKGVDVTLTGTSSVDHLAENLNFFAKPPLPEEVLDRLDKMFGRVDCVSGQQSPPRKI